MNLDLSGQIQVSLGLSACELLGRKFRLWETAASTGLARQQPTSCRTHLPAQPPLSAPFKWTLFSAVTQRRRRQKLVTRDF